MLNDVGIVLRIVEMHSYALVGIHRKVEAETGMMLAAAGHCNVLFRIINALGIDTRGIYLDLLVIAAVAARDQQLTASALLVKGIR